MRENSLMALALLGVIIGASGLGFGVYSTIQMQTGAIKGEDGDDGDDGAVGKDGQDAPGGIEYFCSSQAEILAALNAINTGYGIITITQDIILTQTIIINGGGNYIIQGVNTLIDCGGNRSAFKISNAKYCTIQNLKIDAADITNYTLDIIYISEINDNPVCIENIQIIGDSDMRGTGIRIKSNNVRVRDCYLSLLTSGIYIVYGFKNKIEGNYISNLLGNGIILWYCFSNNTVSGNHISHVGSYGIYLVNSINYNRILENHIVDAYSGIWLYRCNYTIILSNYIIDIQVYGINLQDSNNTIISENYISDIYADSGLILTGIRLMWDSVNNTLIGNAVFNVYNFGGAIGTGIHIADAECANNIVIGNTSLNNEDNWTDDGTNTFGDENKNYFS